MRPGVNAACRLRGFQVPSPRKDGAIGHVEVKVFSYNHRGSVRLGIRGLKTLYNKKHALQPRAARSHAAASLIPLAQLAHTEGLQLAQRVVLIPAPLPEPNHATFLPRLLNAGDAAGLYVSITTGGVPCLG